MTLHKYKTTIYEDGTERNIYRFAPLHSCDDLKKFMISLENICGDIDDIIVKRYIDEHTVLLYEKYEFFPDFLEKFNLEDIKEFNKYEFSGTDKDHRFDAICKIDTIDSTINIYTFDHYENLETDNYEYYKFDNDLIVRYNLDSGRCYYLLRDEKRWVSNNSLISKIEDAAYKYIEISDPLNGMGEEVDRQRIEDAAKRMEYYKQFAYEIGIV